MRKIPFSPPDLSQAEIDEVIKVLKSGWITTGPETKLFESRIAERCHTEKAVCLSSQTSCAELTLRILGIGPGDEVIVPAYTYTATASIIYHVGAKPVMVDCKSGSFEMDYDKMEAAINHNTKVIIPVDLAGVVCDYDRIFEAVERKKGVFNPRNELQEKFGRVIVMADGAHAFGAQWHGKMCGEIADFTNFSFHAVCEFIENTYYKQITREYLASKPCVAIAVFDNAEDFSDNSDESFSEAMLDIEVCLQKWAEQYSALYKKIGNNRYMIIFRDADVEKMAADKFPILKTIRGITINNHSASISVGLCRGYNNIKESELNARKALEMALGRGGDQVAVIKKDNTYEFFGGKVAAAEKASKVRMRVIANAISRVVADCDKIFIMGHKFSDLDCVGAAIGLQCIMEKTFKRYSKVVINRETSMAKQLIEYTDEKLDTDIFISPEAALSGLTQKSLLIIVDTHLKRSLESTELYEKCKKVIIIDHHRKAVDYINNALVFCHEPSASSTCEMCSEIISCLDDSPLTYVQADAMLAGITLDTKNFAVKTGVRTFEAAAYLRKRGANTLTVKGMFSDNIETYREKVDIVCKAHVYRGCAISIAPSGDGDIRLASAQAADEMLNLKGVDASFVLFEDNSQINISARSYGNVNVQIIMEKLGGGGHQTMAATQLKNTTKELAYQQLLSEIDNTLDDEENS